MTLRFLLTSFTTWECHQKTNSSDDLLHRVSQCHPSPETLILLRKLPVESETAIAQTQDYMNRYHPSWVLCCGMAEPRDRLSIESNARKGKNTLRSQIDLEQLIDGLDNIYISHDAGKFVCEDLYYGILETIQIQKLNTRTLFIHVPILHPQNETTICNAFLQLLHRLETL
ncbi:hypothetical protein [Roseofilum casamattae]|uniref:Peptidase C15 n=1 Tax=Roseofilum casamattae BLCC-M143 TaxID=3022442 RepID=A0ABT7BY12_9CYAN|nr:hypothetical protein [Roseofilum casamattae]MDJ1184080.1 peptidase C15 [Roseofilum casamattae BLCC-M143]